MVTQTKTYRRTLSASSISKDKVYNSDREHLGDVHDIMIDIPTGKVAYVVLSFGGFLGMGNKLFAIPWQALAVDETNKCLVLNVDKSRLERAPGFDKENWPDMNDQAWGAEVHTYYGVSPYWE